MENRRERLFASVQDAWYCISHQAVPALNPCMNGWPQSAYETFIHKWIRTRTALIPWQHRDDRDIIRIAY